MIPQTTAKSFLTVFNFLMYIDDLAKLLEHHGITAKPFADDVKVYMIIIKMTLM